MQLGKELTISEIINEAGFASFDLSAQMKLHYDAMTKIEALLKRIIQSKDYAHKSAQLKETINHCMWDEKKGFYFNVIRDCKSKFEQFTLSSYWSLYAQIADKEKAQRMLAYLKDPEYFKTTMPFPALAVKDPQYHEHGDYWRGGVWPPLVYITIKGLMNYAIDIPEAWLLAVNSTKDYLDLLAKTMLDPDDSDSTSDSHCQVVNQPETLDTGSNTLCTDPETTHYANRIFEYNSPSTGGPGMRKDTEGPSKIAKGNFVGWGGLGPIALMQEVGIGIEVHENEVVWYLHQNGSHGIENLHIGKGVLNVLSTGNNTDQITSDTFDIRSNNLSAQGITQVRIIPIGNPDNPLIIEVND